MRSSRLERLFSQVDEVYVECLRMVESVVPVILNVGEPNLGGFPQGGQTCRIFSLLSLYQPQAFPQHDPALLAAALGDVARARGMSDIAKASGLSREALYKALRPDAHPRFDTIARVCSALGVKLVAQPINQGLSKLQIASKGNSKEGVSGEVTSVISPPFRLAKTNFIGFDVGRMYERLT